LRLEAKEDATRDIRQRFRLLAERGHCDPGLLSRFTYDKNDRNAHVRLWRIAGTGNDGEPLWDLPNLEDARLNVQLLTGTRKHELHALTIMLTGKTPSGARWCVALHLPDDRESTECPGGDRQGSGACGHAAFHCHVGPTLDDEPKVRVPLPPLLPAEALDWVLAQVVPDYEPAPWPFVEAALSVSGSRSRGVSRTSEVIFIVEEAPDGGYTARALGMSIVTEADDLRELHAQVKDAVECHFERAERPKVIRLHFVRDEQIAL
jgi:hypothetical protein